MFVYFDEVKKFYESRLKTDENFYLDVLTKIINKPERFIGLFRSTSLQTKIIQNITQSNEIKYGKFIEDITTLYLERLGFSLLPNHQKFKNRTLNIDQLFEKDKLIYIVEQKIRDDHDSTKKEGQFNNFVDKIECIKQKYPEHKIIACMWFVDSSFVKNKQYYEERMKNILKIDCFLFYGDSFFNFLTKSNEVWNELINHLKLIKKEHKRKEININNFQLNRNFLNAITKLPEKLWLKLWSDEEKFHAIRKELISDLSILNSIKLKREKENR